MTKDSPDIELYFSDIQIDYQVLFIEVKMDYTVPFSNEFL